MAESHHDKWAGTGYPCGLTGDKIPLAGRLMAIADVYDALGNRRCYKEPFSHDIAKELILIEEQGSFDPDILEAFLACEDQFKAIAQEIQNGHGQNEIPEMVTS